MKLKGKTESIIIVRYRALKYDNHQGGSGMPFEDKLVFTVDAGMRILELEAQVNQMLDIAIKQPFVGEVDWISTEVH